MSCIGRKQVQRLTYCLLIFSRHLSSYDVLRFCVYYGNDRRKHLLELERYDLVITTYSVVRSDWQMEFPEPKKLLTLHSIKWERIVLDEGE